MGKQVRKPAFDPNQEYSEAPEDEAKVVPMQESSEKEKPKFDPNKPFQEAQESPKKKESTLPSGSGLEKQSAPEPKPSEQSSESAQVPLTKEQQ